MSTTGSGTRIPTPTLPSEPAPIRTAIWWVNFALRVSDALDSYYWFCLNTYGNTTQLELLRRYGRYCDRGGKEKRCRGRRPTWPLGTRTCKRGWIADPLRLLGRDGRDGAETRVADIAGIADASEREAISVLGLVAPVTKADVKVRYKVLAKMLHPDAGKGDKERSKLRSVNCIYDVTGQRAPDIAQFV